MLKMVKVSTLVQRKLIPFRSNIGLGAFRKIKYFGEIPMQLLVPQQHIFAVLLIDSTNPTAEKSSKN